MKGYKMKDKYLEGLIRTNAFVAGAEGKGFWGDVNLSGRPIVPLEEGGFGTVKSISIGVGDKEVLIPTIYDGKEHTDEEAIERYKKTGKSLGVFDSVEEADKAAKDISDKQGVDYNLSDPYTKDLNVTQYDIPELYHGKQTPDRIITHRTAGRGFHTPSDSRALEGGLGAHYTVDREGKVHQIGDPTTKMWHAGPKGNTNSIGIEATGRYDEATGKWEDLTEAQERSIAQLGKNLMSEYGISSERIYPHYTLAAKSGTEGDMVMGVLRNQ